MLNFISYYRKTFAGTAGRRSLYGSVERKYIGLLSDAVNQSYDITDFLGGLAQAFNAFGCLLNLLAYGVHTIDGFADLCTTGVGDFYGVVSHIAGLGRPLRHGVKRHCYLLYDFCRFTNLFYLHCRSSGQFGC